MSTPRPTRPYLAHTSPNQTLAPRPTSYIERGGRASEISELPDFLKLTPEQCRDGLKHLAELRAAWAEQHTDRWTRTRTPDA